MTDKKEIKVVDAEHCLDFDVLLNYLGDFGCYQKRLLLYMIPFTFSWCFIYFTQIFLIILPPDYWCYISELAHLPKDEQRNLGIPKQANDDFNQCAMYDQNYTYLLEAKITEANESWPQIPCQDWVYDKKQLPYQTIATEYNWVCQKEILGTYTVAIFFLGSILGGIIFGYATDHWGRIPAVMLCNVCGFVGGVLSAFCKNFWWFSLTRFVVGMAYDNCCAPFFILVLEYVGPKYRTLITNFSIAVYFTPCAVILPWIALWCNGWRLLSLITSIPIFITLFMVFFVSESARWLVTVGKIDKSLKIVKNVAKTNGKTLPEDVLDSFQKCCVFTYNQERTSKTYTVLDLFKSFQSCRIISILCFLWMIASLVYDAHVRAIAGIGPDIFYTFSFACLVELPAGLVPLFLLDITGRKVLSLIAFLSCAVGSFVAAMLKEKRDIAIAACVARFFATMNFNIGLQWAAEILPTVVRGQGLAFIHIMGFVASILSPFVLFTETFYIAMPMLILSGLSILTAILVCFLPETNGYALPQTFEDAEKLWNQKVRFPWPSKRNH